MYENEVSKKGILSLGFKERDILNQIANTISYFLDGYAKSKRKSRWVEKTTHNVNVLDTIDEAFHRKPLYIAIVRHGLDVSYSLANLTFDKFSVLDKYKIKGNETKTAAVIHWSDMNEKIIDFKSRNESRVKLIKYESLTHNPISVIQEICNFLGEVFEVEMIKYNNFKHDKGYDDPYVSKHKIVKHNSYNYKEWPFDLQKKLYTIAQKTFDKLGYKL